MRVVVIGLPGLAEDAALHGHLVVADVTSAAEVLPLIDTLAPELVVAAVTPDGFGADALTALDARGIRLVPVVQDEQARRYATSMGLLDTADAPVAWSVVEHWWSRPATSGFAGTDHGSRRDVPGPGVADPGMPGSLSGTPAAGPAAPAARGFLSRRGLFAGRGSRAAAANAGAPGAGAPFAEPGTFGSPTAVGAGSPLAGPGAFGSPAAPAPGAPFAGASPLGASAPPVPGASFGAPAPAPGTATPTAPGAAPATPAAPVPTRATVIAVWGPAGAPGRTSLAVAIASEIAATGVSVILADADTHAASIAPALGLLDEAPGFAAACRLAGLGGLTRAELDRVAQTYAAPGAAFRVLTGLGRPSRWPELQHERVRGTLEACRAWADVIVVDVAASLENDEEISSDLLAPRRNAATITCVREADIVVAVGSADPVGLARLLRGHQELMELVTTPRVHVVANKVRATAIGLQPQGQVRQTLSRFGGIEDPALVPWDPAAFDAALLSGRTLAEVAPRSPARLAVKALVERMTPGAERTRVA